MSEKNKALINQIIRFGLVGISNTIVSYVIYAVAFALTDNYFLSIAGIHSKIIISHTDNKSSVTRRVHSQY